MIRTWPIYLLLIVAFVLYFFFQTTPTLAVIFGAIVFFSVIILFIIEITNGVKEEGYVKKCHRNSDSNSACGCIMVLFEILIKI